MEQVDSRQHNLNICSETMLANDFSFVHVVQLTEAEYV